MYLIGIFTCCIYIQWWNRFQKHPHLSTWCYKAPIKRDEREAGLKPNIVIRRLVYQLGLFSSLLLPTALCNVDTIARSSQPTTTSALLPQTNILITNTSSRSSELPPQIDYSSRALWGGLSIHTSDEGKVFGYSTSEMKAANTLAPAMAWLPPGYELVHLAKGGEWWGKPSRWSFLWVHKTL